MNQQILVTGGNGFLALHIIKQLLTQGYAVRATLRSLAKATDVRQTLTAAHTPHLDQLSFVAADLTQDAGWATAMSGISGVMSVAAPVFVNGERVTTTLANAATAGTERILRAALAAGVKRVVMTANLGAVGFSSFDPRHVITEADWTATTQRGLSAYELSKLVAEHAAWDFVAQHPELELVTVNAGAMLGPALGQHVTGSFGLITRLLTGKPTPNLMVNVVDVRDVADIHVRALSTPTAANQRFLAVADTPISMQAIVTLLRQQRPELTTHLPHHLLPSGLVHLLAPFNTAAREADLMLRLGHQVSNQHARTTLGWQPISDSATAVLAAADSLHRKQSS